MTLDRSHSGSRRSYGRRMPETQIANETGLAACPLEQLPALLRLPEVAAVLRVSSSTIERMLDRGVFGSAVIRFGRNVRVSRDGLAAFLAAHADELASSTPHGPRDPAAGLPRDRRSATQILSELEQQDRHR